MKYQFKSLQLIAAILAALAIAPSIASANELDIVTSQSIEESAVAACSKCRTKGKSKRLNNLRSQTFTPLIAQADPSAPPAPEPAPAAPESTPKAPEANPPKADKPEPNFLTNTKIGGQVVFGVTGGISGDFTNNLAFGNRTRLELTTKLGEGELFTRIQSVGLGLNNSQPTTLNTPEGSLSWTDGTTNNSLGIDALKYTYPLSPNTQVVFAANAGAADDFTDTINPYFDGDGNSGAISTFANRHGIYYGIGGAGAGIRHKFSDSTEFSLGYMAGNGSETSAGNGLLGGAYGAIAQLTLKTGENSKVGLTYSRTFNSDFGTGSTNANQGGTSNNIGAAGSFQLSPGLALGGWAGYTQNRLASGDDRQIWNWAVTAALPNAGGEGNLLGFLIGQEPKVTGSSAGVVDTKTSLHIEGFYQVKLNDSLSITPGIIYLTAPNQDINSRSAVIGALRTTFSF
jgi:hypothetical protein